MFQSVSHVPVCVCVMRVWRAKDSFVELVLYLCLGCRIGLRLSGLLGIRPLSYLVSLQSLSCPHHPSAPPLSFPLKVKQSALLHSLRLVPTSSVGLRITESLLPVLIAFLGMVVLQSPEEENAAAAEENKEWHLEHKAG